MEKRRIIANVGCRSANKSTLITFTRPLIRMGAGAGGAISFPGAALIDFRGM